MMRMRIHSKGSSSALIDFLRVSKGCEKYVAGLTFD